MNGWLVRALAWLSCLVLFSGAAHAQGGARFVLVAGNNQELGRHLLAEARQAGFDIVVQQGDEQAASSELARRNHAVGVLRATASGAVELWLVGDAQQPPTSTRFRQESGETGFAVRVIEETRSRVVALHLPELAARDAPAPAAADRQQRAPVPSAKARGLDVLDAGAGLGLTKAVGLGATLHAELHARARLTSRVGAGAFAFVPLAQNELTGPEGTGRARVYLFGAGLHWLAWRPAAALRTELGVGAGAVWLPLRADANTGFQAHADHLASAIAFASASLDVTLTSSVGLRASALAGVSMPRPVVRFEGREVASWGRLFVGSLVAVEVTFPE